MPEAALSLKAKKKENQEDILGPVFRLFGVFAGIEMRKQPIPIQRHIFGALDTHGLP